MPSLMLKCWWLRACMHTRGCLCCFVLAETSIMSHATMHQWSINDAPLLHSKTKSLAALRAQHKGHGRPRQDAPFLF